MDTWIHTQWDAAINEQWTQGNSKDALATAHQLLTELIDTAICSHQATEFYDKALWKDGILHVRNLASQFLAQKQAVGSKNDFISIPSGIFDDTSLFSNERIRNMIFQAGLQINNERMALEHVIQKEFVLDATQKNSILSSIKTLSFEQLKMYNRKIHIRREFVLWIDRGIAPRDIAGIIEHLWFSDSIHPVLLDRFHSLMRQVQVTWVVTEDDCSFLLSLLDTSSREKQKFLIQELLPRVSIGFLIEHNFLDIERAKILIIQRIDADFWGVDESVFSSHEELDRFISSLLDGNPEFFIRTDSTDFLDTLVDDFFISFKEDLNAALYEWFQSLRGGNQDENPPDIEDFSQFNAYIRETLKDPSWQGCLIKGLENFERGGIICYETPQGWKFFMKIMGVDTMNPPETIKHIQVSSISYTGWQIWAPQLPPEELLYADLVKEFQTYTSRWGKVTILDEAAFEHMKLTNRIPEISPEPELSNPEAFQARIDSLDPAHRDIAFEVGTYFQFWEEDEYDILKVDSINYTEQIISLQSEDGTIYPNIPFTGFIEWIRAEHETFARMKPIHDGDSFLEAFSEPGLSIHENSFQMQQWDGSKSPIFGFKNANGAIIKVEITGLNTVNILEPVSDVKRENKEDGEVKYKKTKKYAKHADKSFRHLMRWVRGYKLTSLLDSDPDAVKEYEAPHLHMHGGFLGRVMNWKTPYDFWKAGGMIFHTFEHMLKEGAEFRSAESMFKMSKKLSKIPGFSMLENHAMMDYSKHVNKTIEEKKGSIRNLKWARMRAEIVHIIENSNSRPEHLLAALLVTLEATGELYADSNLDKLSGKGHIWFDRIVRACWCDPAYEYKRCQERESAVNTETSNTLNEIILLDRFFKFNHENNIYIQAMGGPGVFGNTVREAREKNKQKWERESSEKLGAKDRAIYTISRFKSGEWSLVLGNIKGTMGKWPGQSSMGPAFVWSMSNVTKMAHPETLNDFKNFTDAEWNPYHAFTFWRNDSLAWVYQSVVHTVVVMLADSGKLPEQARTRLKMIELDRSEQLNNPNIYEVIHDFWLDYGKIIHPVLQLSDPLIAIQSKEHRDPIVRTTFARYIRELDGTHEYAPSSAHPNESIRNMGGYSHSEQFISSHSPIDSSTGFTYHTLKHYLDLKINVVPKHGDMNETDYKYFWKSAVIPYLESIKKSETFQWNTEYQKWQFSHINKEIVAWLRDKLKGATAAEKTTLEERKDMYERTIMRHPYMLELRDLWFDMSYENILGVDNPKEYTTYGSNENAYQAFLHKEVSSVQTVQQVTRQAFIAGVSDAPAANDQDIRMRA